MVFKMKRFICSSISFIFPLDFLINSDLELYQEQADAPGESAGEAGRRWRWERSATVSAGRLCPRPQGAGGGCRASIRLLEAARAKIICLLHAPETEMNGSGRTSSRDWGAWGEHRGNHYWRKTLRRRWGQESKNREDMKDCSMYRLKKFMITMFPGF